MVFKVWTKRSNTYKDSLKIKIQESSVMFQQQDGVVCALTSRKRLNSHRIH